MALYDWQCLNLECNYKFEEDVKIDDIETGRVLLKCPECGHENIERVISNPAHYKHVSWSSWRVGGDS